MANLQMCQRRSSLHQSLLMMNHPPVYCPSAVAQDFEAPVTLNNLGAGCFESGDFEKAFKCFRNAVRWVAPSTLALMLELSSTVSDVVGTKAKDIHVDLFGCSSSTPIEESDGTKTSQDQDGTPSSKKKAKTSGASASATQDNYDEGMSTYNFPMRVNAELLREDDNDKVVVSIILFNLGLYHVQKREDGDATFYFSLALSMIECCQSQKEETKGDDDMSVSSDRSNFLSPHVVATIAIPILHNLGHILYRDANYKDAIRIYSKALMLAQRASRGRGELRALDRARALNSIGVSFFHMPRQNYAKHALRAFKSAMEIQRKYLHNLSFSSQSLLDVHSKLELELATTLNNIGRVHFMLNQYEEALPFYIEAISIRRDALPCKHLDLAASIFNLGQTYYQIQKLDEAMKLFQEFRSMAELNLGPSHRDIAIILRFIAQVHHEQRNHTEATKYYLDSLKIAKSAFGYFDSEVAATLNKIGNLFFELADYDSALRYYEEGLIVERFTLGACDPNIIITLTNIAQTHKAKGHLNSALSRYTEVCSLQRFAYGPNDDRLAASLGTVAQLSCKLGHYTRALDAYQEVLRIQRDKTEENNDLSVSKTLYSIGLVLFKQGFHSLALESFQECLRLRCSTLGKDHQDVAAVWYNIATIHLERGDHESALACYNETLRVEKMTMGASHPNVASTLQQLASFQHHRGHLDKALECYLEILKIETNNGDDAAIGWALEKIGHLHLQQKNLSEAMECFAESTRKTGSYVEVQGLVLYDLSNVNPASAAAA